jgi:phage terminase small subunit
MTLKTPKPPRHLAAATRRWWASVVAGWDLEDHHIRLLTLAAQAWDRAELARVDVARDGLSVPTRDGGRKAHPSLKALEAAEISFARLIRELDLDVVPPAASSRPPTLRSIAR